MSKKYAATAGLLGMLAGALIGTMYLDAGSTCANVEGPQFSCTLNHSIAPFIGCIALGFVLGIAIARNGQKLWLRFTVPDEVRKPDRTAPATDDATVELATWGRAPHAKGPAVAPTTPAPAAPKAEEGAPQARRDVALGSRGKPRPTPRSQG